MAMQETILSTGQQARTMDFATPVLVSFKKGYVRIIVIHSRFLACLTTMVVHPEDVYDTVFDSKNYRDFNDNWYNFAFYEDYNGLVLTNVFLAYKYDMGYIDYYFGFMDTMYVSK